MTDIQLYPDQEEFVEKIRRELRLGSRSVLGVGSTGIGKTIISAFITREAELKGNRVWFVCHLKNLLTQTSQAFWAMRIQHGLIASGKRQSNLPVQVATIGTLVRRLDKLKAPQLLILDESHLAMSKSWLQVVEWARERGTIIIGNSATPCRLDGKGLGYIFDSMVEARPMRWLIDNNRLSDYEVYSTKMAPDMSDAKTQGGDWSAHDAEAAMDKPRLIGDSAAHWLKYAKGKRTIAYCATIKHSKHTVEHFNAHGIPAVHVDGTTPPTELKAAIQGFADGKYMVLSNVALMTTGFDLSAQVKRDVPIEACILLRPTQSLSLYLQMVGRALRKKDTPAIVLDHAGNVMRFGLPCEERVWSLEGEKKGRRKKGDDEPDVNVQQCGSCFGIFRPGPETCPRCGEPIEKKPRRELQQEDGELERINMEAVIEARKAAKAEQGAARGLRDLVELSVRKGMKNPAGWAANVYAAREKSKPTPADFAEAKRILREVQQ